MADRISTEPERATPPILDFPAASTCWSAPLDAARETGELGVSVSGSWIDPGAELESLCKRSLCDALEAEAGRLLAETARIDEQIVRLDARMHLALARQREDRARAAIRSIIALRRRSRALYDSIDRIQLECKRLSAALRRRQADAANALPLPPPASLSRPRRSAPSSVFSSGTSAPWVRRRLRPPSRGSL